MFNLNFMNTLYPMSPHLSLLRLKVNIKINYNCNILIKLYILGFPGSSNGKRICLQHRTPGFDPWVGKIPREGKGYPPQYSCLGNPMDGGAWRATVYGVTKSRS